MKISLPPVLGIDIKIKGNIVKQYIQTGYEQEVNISEFLDKGVKGYILTPIGNAENPILVIKSGHYKKGDYKYVLRIDPKIPNHKEDLETLLASSKWERYPISPQISYTTKGFRKQISQIQKSWVDSFSYREENVTSGIKGLRSPQVGAVHAIQSHWSVSNEPATIVMPTGTGKTEVMLSILVATRCEKVLVIVSTDALRTQISNKFLSLGLLKEIGVLSKKALYPIVGILKSKPTSIADVDELFEKCNVIISTINVAGQCSEELKERIAQHCTYLFVDEAHHIAATTWKGLRMNFINNKILQFTATPFRDDDKPIDGKVIYNFPLRKAQELNYFKPINFNPIEEYDPIKSDEVIAAKAVEQLRIDRQKYNHVLMARAGSIVDAKRIFSIYEKYKEFCPVIIHSGLSSKVRENTRKEIITGKAKIVVCVDMFGEGFDLPELKIAAFHDVRKSLPITLQLAGRFIRSRKDLGEPTFIANIADVNFRNELKKLYTQDADWNELLPECSEQAIISQTRLHEFIRNFSDPPKDIPLHLIRPAMSTAVYRTNCTDWDPDSFTIGIEGLETLEFFNYSINKHDNTLLVITARKELVDWVRIQDIYSIVWELLIVYWDQDQHLLYINSSSNSGYYKKLAEAVAGPDVSLITGPDIFRCFANINRLKLQNVGLNEHFGRLVRYTMKAGPDVEPGVPLAQRQNATKSNIFGAGYEKGKKTTLGCSRRGRIWSHQVGNIESLINWCYRNGEKLLNEKIDPDEVMNGTLVPIQVFNRPEKMPVYIDWSEDIYDNMENKLEVFIDDEEIPLQLSDVELRLKDPAENGAILFDLVSESQNIGFIFRLFKKDEYSDCSFSIIGNHRVLIRWRGKQTRAEDFFNLFPPSIWFSDGSELSGNTLTVIKADIKPYSPEKIITWDWTGVDIRKESQGISRENDSIQYKVIQELKKDDGIGVIFDDDGAGEVADIVTIKDEGNLLRVDLYHCKYSSENQKGSRIKDLYEVCGQAQKCTHWMTEIENFFTHLQKREAKRISLNNPSRFDKGDIRMLSILKAKSSTTMVKFKIYIVQPGLSRKDVSIDQLQLLSVTENYLMETRELALFIIANT